MARDKFHYEVRTALEEEGWVITNDPLNVKVGKIPMQIDLGADKLIGAERAGEKIAVEIKTFNMSSFITSFYEAIGKYIVYREALLEVESDRILYLAVPKTMFDEYGNEPLVARVFAVNKIKIIIYEPQTQIITSWLT
jgi:hypothetical protein